MNNNHLIISTNKSPERKLISKIENLANKWMMLAAMVWRTSIATIDIFRLSRRCCCAQQRLYRHQIYLLPHEGSITNRQLRQLHHSAIPNLQSSYTTCSITVQSLIRDVQLTPRSQYRGIPISLGTSTMGSRALFINPAPVNQV